MTLYNLARMTTNSTGTGDIVLGVAVSGYLTFDEAGVQNGDTVSYSIQTPTESEVGTGVYTTATKTLTRTVTKSTNSDAALNLDGVNQQVAITVLAEDITTNHAALSNLDYASAGHTGFQPAGSYLTAETDPIVGAVSGIVKADGLGNISAAAAGTDYQSPLTPDVDYLIPATIASTYPNVTISTANGLSLVGQALSLAAAASGTTGALTGTDWDTFSGKIGPSDIIDGGTWV